MQCSAETLAIVTGGASGLGRATVQSLRQRGCPVVSIDLPGPAGEARALQDGAAFQGIDLSDPSAVNSRIDALVAAHGIPRLLVNCAGVAPAAKTVSRAGRHNAAQFARVVAINLTGCYLVAAAVAEHMIGVEPLPDGERGVIINTASIAAFDGQTGQCAYAASKAGVAGLTLPMARDLAQFGIRVCAIAPGVFDTPMVRTMPDDVKSSLLRQIPFPRRFGHPEEFAALAVHIIENRLLNGETIRLDGAMRMGAS